MTPRVSASVLSGALALLVAGCGGAPSSPAIDAAVADELAARADTLAGQLDADDGCGARETAAELVATTEGALADRTLTEPAAAEIIRTTRDAVAAVPCEPPAPPAPADDEREDEDDDREERGKGEGKRDKGRDKGKDKGREGDDD